MASLFQSQLSVIYGTEDSGWIIDEYMKCKIDFPVFFLAPAPAPARDPSLAAAKNLVVVVLAVAG